MTTETAPLPDDIEQLKQLVIAQRLELEHLKLLLAKLRRLQFGRSSEKLDRELGQRELELEELEISQDKVLARVRAARPEPAAPRRQPCRASSAAMSRDAVVPTVAVCCARLARMSPRCSSTCLSSSR